jgi:hypothetical protein
VPQIGHFSSGSLAKAHAQLTHATKVDLLQFDLLTAQRNLQFIELVICATAIFSAVRGSGVYSHDEQSGHNPYG